VPRELQHRVSHPLNQSVLSTTHSLTPNRFYSHRAHLNTATFRYLNNVSFPNISPRWWEGAYHTSELPLLFGTYAVYGNASPMALESATSAEWQDLYVAFARDPVNALPALGWPSYNRGPGGKPWMWNPRGEDGDVRVVSELIEAGGLSGLVRGLSGVLASPD
jgi:hypothetical protein